MGSGNYFNDVTTARKSVGTSRSTLSAFTYSEQAAAGRVQGVHPLLNIHDKFRECCDSAEHPLSTPVVVAMDVTSSRGQDAKAIYGQVPSFLGSLKLTGVVPDPAICWAAVGDYNSDKAPLQVGQFESDRRIDEYLDKLWLEEGGGGTGEESYELLAYYLAKKTKLDCLKRGKKGFVFFLGDEAPYSMVSKDAVQKLIGDVHKKDLPTEEVFRDLSNRFKPFLVFPRTTMEQRKTAIDSEIRQRLVMFGGKFEKVSIRCSLIWNNRNDLDLHCETPLKEHMYYGYKTGRCGGFLDIDQNVRGENPKPVENMRWEQGRAPEGRYTFYVENYAFHDDPDNQGNAVDRATPFKVELDIDGEIQTFTGQIEAGMTHQRSRVEVFSFVYKQGSKAKSAQEDSAAQYRDDVVLAKWARYLPPTQILRIQDADSAVEVMLGAMAISEGAMNLDAFTASMKERKVPKDRRDDVAAALREYAAHGVFADVGNVFG